MPKSTVSEEGSEVDRGSVCSTIASTTSLSSRIACLALDFEDKFRHLHHDTSDFPPVYEGEEGTESEEEHIEISEDQLLRELDSMEPSLQVASRVCTSIDLPAFSLQKASELMLCSHCITLIFCPQVCSRLFKDFGNDLPVLKRLTWSQLVEFREKG